MKTAHDVPASETLRSAPRDGAGRAGADVPPFLLRAVCADDLTLAPVRTWLDGVEEVHIGRGGAGATRSGPVLSVSIADRYASAHHAVLRRDGRAFVVRDMGSTNGTWVDGVRLHPGEERHVVSASLEVGRTFFHLRTDARGTPELPMHPGTQEPVTWNPELAQGFLDAGRLARRAHDLLVTGPTGAGKEVAAAWLHATSGRSGRLVAVNCAALPEQLLEDELFGHVRGAFSNAQTERTGLVRAAHEGTLLLDEVAELAPGLQAKLLRVLEDRRVRPVGSEREHPVDVLVIAATHQDLPRLVARGRFREDLYARLGLLPLHLGPLSERREDVGPLVARMVRDGSVPASKLRFVPEALRALVLHSWPLNVRQLRRVVLAAVDLATAGPSGTVEIGLEHLRLSQSPVPATAPAQVTAAAEPRPTLSDEDRELRARLVELLRQHDGNVAGVARALGKSRTGVQRLLARLGLRRSLEP